MNAELVPNLEKALAHYAQIAHEYDQQTRKIEHIRQLAIDALQLKQRQTVIDAGCGTGACLRALARQVGLQGRVIGVEPSVDLIAQAHMRAQALHNVCLLQQAAEEASLPGAHADAVLFCYTHDLMQSKVALQRLFAACKPGARVVAVGTQLVPMWLWPVRKLQRFTHRHYITARDSMNLPYGVLSQYLEAFSARRVFPWHSYLAVGKLKAEYAER